MDERKQFNNGSPIKGTLSSNKITQAQFQCQLPSIISHMIEGEIKRGKCFGIHFFNAEIHQVKSILKEPNLLGVWEADIEVKHPKTKVFVKKKKSSTLFPLTWTKTDLAIKLIEAFANAKFTTSYKSIGITSCQIEIVFIFQNGMITSCYPIC
ncbi:MAG TPA: EndoU domain-containing protein [Chitinophagaceae bacterium]|nr:EndoU domain-containing protein [Chitinophagaceae bacterium]